MASLSEPQLDELAGAFLWYIYIYRLYIIVEQSEPHTYRTAEKNLRHIYIYIYIYDFLYIYIYIYIYMYIYIRSFVVHVPFTRALRANVGPAG